MFKSYIEGLKQQSRTRAAKVGAVIVPFVGLALIYFTNSEIAEKGCIQIRGGNCITAQSDPGQYYFYASFFYVFTILAFIQLAFFAARWWKERRNKHVADQE